MKFCAADSNVPATSRKPDGLPAFCKQLAAGFQQQRRWSCPIACGSTRHPPGDPEGAEGVGLAEPVAEIAVDAQGLLQVPCPGRVLTRQPPSDPRSIPPSTSTTTRPSPRIAERVSPRTGAPGCARRPNRAPARLGLAADRPTEVAGCGIFVGILG